MWEWDFHKVLRRVELWQFSINSFHGGTENLGEGVRSYRHTKIERFGKAGVVPGSKHLPCFYGVTKIERIMEVFEIILIVTFVAITVAMLVDAFRFIKEVFSE